MGRRCVSSCWKGFEERVGEQALWRVLTKQSTGTRRRMHRQDKHGNIIRPLPEDGTTGFGGEGGGGNGRLSDQCGLLSLHISWTAHALRVTNRK